MKNNYYDVESVIQVIGNVFNTPQLLDYTDKYTFREEDFDDDFHKVIFGTIYKLYTMGTKQLNVVTIEKFLEGRPKSLAIYKTNNGRAWLDNVSDIAISSSFDYYYDRMKKFTLLREFNRNGIDVNYLYDPNEILDVKKRQAQEDFLDNSSLVELYNKINERIDMIRENYVEDKDMHSYQAGDGARELKERLKKYPEVGVPLYGPLINTITRGARLKKFYLFSAPTGMGKSRNMIANTCYIGCEKYYDNNFGWIRNGVAEPTLYITTELELEEVQTMMWAFISGVNEDHILNSTYEEGEEERVDEAIKILEESPIYIEELPDFSLDDVEAVIKKAIRERGVKYVLYDYIHTSLKILEEITKKSGGIKLREDNILFMMAIRLKDLCNQYGIFLMSSTQLNGDWKEAKIPDQNLLRGRKITLCPNISYPVFTSGGL